MTTRKKDGDSEPISIAESQPDSRPAPPHAPPATVGLRFVHVSPGRAFLEVLTIPLAELPFITIGRNSAGPNGYGLIAVKGRMFSRVGDYVPDDPSREALRGLPVYAEV